MEKVLRFLKQPSTQKSILTLATLVGWGVSPENLDKIIVGAAAVFAAIEGLRDEDKPRAGQEK